MYIRYSIGEVKAPIAKAKAGSNSIHIDFTVKYSTDSDSTGINYTYSSTGSESIGKVQALIKCNFTAK